MTVEWELDNADYLLQAMSTGVSDHALLHLITSVGFCPQKALQIRAILDQTGGVPGGGEGGLGM